MYLFAYFTSHHVSIFFVLGDGLHVATRHVLPELPGLEEKHLKNKRKKRPRIRIPHLGLFGSTAFEVVVVLHGAVPHLAKVGTFLRKVFAKIKKETSCDKAWVINQRIHANMTQVFQHSNVHSKNCQICIHQNLRILFSKNYVVFSIHVGHFKGQLASWQSGPPPSSEGLSFEGQTFDSNGMSHLESWYKILSHDQADSIDKGYS